MRPDHEPIAAAEITQLATPPLAPGRASPWLISQFPELDHLTAEDRRRVLRAVPLWTYPYVIASSIFFAAIAAMFPVGLLIYVTRVAANVGFLLFGMAWLVLAGYFYAVQLRTIRRSMRSEIVRRCHGERLPFCFACGYDLRGGTPERCPECGGQSFSDCVKNITRIAL